MFRKKKEKSEKKSVHKIIQDRFFIRIQGRLLRLRKRLGSIKHEREVREARRELEKLRREFVHINARQRKYILSLFRQCEKGIENLERSFKNIRKKQLNLCYLFFFL